MKTRSLFCLVPALVLLLGWLPSRSFAANYSVTNANDAGTGSLRQAVLSAVAAGGSNTVTFDASLNAQTITLTAASGSLNVSAGTLSISAASLGQGITVSGADAVRIFNVTSGASLSLNRLRLVHGTSGTSTSTGGGAIQAVGSPVTLTDCTFTDNSAPSYAGGAIYFGGSAALTATNCTFDRNVAGDTGALYLIQTVASTFNNCTFTGNSGTGSNATGAITVGGPVTFTHCTVFANTGGGGGGGIYVAAATTLNRCLIAGNTVTGTGTSPDIYLNGGTISTASSANLIGNNGSGLTGSAAATFPAGTLVGTPAAPLDPKLRPLGPGGGITWTLAPLTGSPALDAGGATSPLSTDQRGFPRVVNGACDLGSVERGLVFTVSNANDTGSGSLRGALAAVTQPDTRIQFNSSLSGQTLVLASSLQPPVGSNVELDGSTLTSALTLSGNAQFRILNCNGAASLALNRLTLTAGSATDGYGGGALYAQANGIIAVDCTFSGNAATATGGALNFQGNSAVALHRCTVSGNSGPSGAISYFGSGLIRMTNCTVSANANGGVQVLGITELELTHCTVTGTTAGAGVSLGNFPALRLERCAIAGNSGNASPDITRNSGVITSVGANLIGNDGGTGSGNVSDVFPAGSLVGTPSAPLNALLAPLLRTGGFTATHSPLVGSPALDAAGTSPLLTDQRGLPRGVGTGSDLGAVERGPFLSITSANDTGTGTLRTQLAAVTSPDTTLAFASSLNGYTVTLGSALVVPASVNVAIDASALPAGITISGNNAVQILNVAVNATVTLNRLRLVRGNSGSGNGGALNSDVGTTLAFADCTFLDNVGGSSGGAINTSAIISAANCTFERNSAIDAGAIYLYHVVGNNYANCTFTANRATGSTKTGAVVVDGSGAAFTHCTFFGNSGGSSGGGLLVNANALATFNRCIIAGNTAGFGISPDIYQTGGTIFTVGSNNLIGNNGNGLSGSAAATFPAGALVGTPSAPLDPKLRPLGPSGGVTWTLAPLTGSPALDAGGATSPLSTDQRGFPRVVNGGVSASCDLGSVERGPVVSVTNANDTGFGSLRGALAAVTQPDTRLQFASALSAQTLVLASSLQPPVGSNVELDGSTLTSALTLSGNAQFRILNCNGAASLTLNRLTLTAGSATDGYGGGALYAQANGIIAVDCTFSGNAATATGGALNFQGNSAVALHRCTVSGNSGPSGAVYYQDLGLIRLTNCTVSGNANGGVQARGLVQATTGTELELTHCTVTGNTAGAGVILTNSPTLRLERCVIAGNSGNASPDITRYSGVITSVGANLVGNDGGTGSGNVSDVFPAGSLVGTPAAPLNALLAPLDNYGGLTFTHALQPGSLARDAAAGSTLLTDQRGLPRVGAADLGSYEAGEPNPNYNAYIWELLPPSATVAQHAANADFDGDGNSNYLEYLTGTDASNVTSAFRPTASIAPGMIALTFPTVIGRTYILQTSTDLQSWVGQGGTVGTGQPIQLTASSSVPRLFARILVSP